VRKNSTARVLRRRIVALAAAYAIALSSLFASAGAARAAAEAAAVAGGIICQTLVAGQPAPSPDETNGKICADCCCVGCLMLMAAVPPPPAKAVALAQSSSRTAAALETWRLPTTILQTSARPRGPPLAV